MKYCQWLAQPNVPHLARSMSPLKLRAVFFFVHRDSVVGISPLWRFLLSVPSSPSRKIAVAEIFSHLAAHQRQRGHQRLVELPAAVSIHTADTAPPNVIKRNLFDTLTKYFITFTDSFSCSSFCVNGNAPPPPKKKIKTTHLT